MSRQHHPSTMNQALYLLVEGLPAEAEEMFVSPLLTCGHYGLAITDQSDVWNHPDEAWRCPSCSEERQIDLRLQVQLMDGVVV